MGKVSLESGWRLAKNDGNGGVIKSPIARRMGIGNVVRDVGLRAFACRTIFLLECTGRFSHHFGNR